MKTFNLKKTNKIFGYKFDQCICFSFPFPLEKKKDTKEENNTKKENYDIVIIFNFV